MVELETIRDSKTLAVRGLHPYTHIQKYCFSLESLEFSHIRGIYRCFQCI